MLCPACQAQNLTGATVCAACGAPFAAAAPPSERPTILRPAGPALRPPGAVVRHDDQTVTRPRPVEMPPTPRQSAPQAPPTSPTRPSSPQVAAPPVAAPPAARPQVAAQQVASPRVAAPQVAPPQRSTPPPPPGSPPPPQRPASPLPPDRSTPPAPQQPAQPTMARPQTPPVAAHTASPRAASAHTASPNTASPNTASPNTASPNTAPPQPSSSPSAAPAHPAASTVTRPTRAEGARVESAARALPSLWRQVLADAVDTLLAVVPAVLAFFALNTGAGGAAAKGGAIEQSVDMLMASAGSLAFAVFVGVGVHVVHHVVIFSKISTTLGGLLLGLRVYSRKTSAPISVVKAALRGVFSGVGVALVAIGPLYAYWIDGYRRGLGDLLGNTIVLPRDEG